MQLVDLGIDLERTFDKSRALNLTQATKIIKGRGGHIHREIALRWANPRRGFRPHGVRGPVVVLPSLKIDGLRFTMPEWVLAFEEMRQRLTPKEESHLGGTGG